MLNFLRYHWYDVGVVSALVAYRYYHVNQHQLSTPQKFLLANFIVVCLHQFEEYRFPGGFPAIMNTAVQGSSTPDRYPLNANSAMITNVAATYGLYLPTIFYPQALWLGLSSVLFGFAQVWIHGIMINIKVGALYNPGVLTAILGHVPVGIGYIRSLQEKGQLRRNDWILGVFGAFGIGYFGLMKSTFGWLPDESTQYPFTASEMTRFGARLAGLA